MPSTLQKSYRNTSINGDGALVQAGNWAVVGWNLINPNSVNVYFKIWNAAALADVVGASATVTEASETLLIPASGTVFLSNEDKYQVACPLGIVVTCVTGIADNSTTSPASGCYVRLLYNQNY